MCVLSSESLFLAVVSFRDFREGLGTRPTAKSPFVLFQTNAVPRGSLLRATTWILTSRYSSTAVLVSMSRLWDKLYGGGSGSGSGGFFPPMEGGGGGKDQTPQVQGEGMKWTGFDPTGLERAAKAARELEQSRKYW